MSGATASVIRPGAACSASRATRRTMSSATVSAADILSVLFVPGAAAAVTPGGLEADHYFFLMQFPAMLLLLAIFRVGISTARGGKLERPFGLALLGTYLAVTLTSYLLAGAA